jgi:hypothetical protein
MDDLITAAIILILDMKAKSSIAASATSEAEKETKRPDGAIAAVKGTY